MNDLKGRVRQFSRYTDEQLAQTRNDLRLGMTIGQLKICASFYKEVKRDPYIGELRMLDRLNEATANDPAAVTLSSLSTNDRMIADTYADLLRKRRELLPDAALPLSVADGFRLATDYLKRAGMRADLPMTTLFCEDRATAGGTIGESFGIGISDSRFQLRVLPRTQTAAAIQPDDTFVLLLPSDGETPQRYQKTVSAFLSDASCRFSWKMILSVPESGLLTALLGICNGATVFPASLTDAEEAASLSRFIGQYAGCRLLTVSPRDLQATVKCAEQAGLCTAVVAAVSAGGNYCFDLDDVSFALPSAFLRAQVQRKAVSANLKKETGVLADALRHVPVSRDDCRYLAGKTAPVRRETVLLNRTVSAASHLTVRHDAFLSAIRAILSPVATLAAAGYACAEQRLTLGITLDGQSETGAGDAAALMLGVYRAQAELGIAAPAISVLSDHQTALTVFSSVSGEEQAQDRFAAVGNRIYCFAPVIGEDGLPDFASVRSLFENLAAWRKNGRTFSARVLAGECVTDGLAAMRRDGLYCRLASDRIASDGPLPFAVLIETAEPFDGILPVGTVEAGQAEEECVKTQKFPPKNPALRFWSETPEAVLFSRMRDTDALILAEKLRASGVSVHHFFSDDPHAAGKLSRAMLGAGILLICGNDPLPDAPEVAFALDTMKRAGASILRVTEDLPFDESTWKERFGA